MRTNRRLLFSLLVSTPLLCAASWAWYAPEPSADLQGLWEYLDRDGDGLVGPYEGAEAFLLLSQEADLDGDGSLGLEELSAQLARAHEDELAERRDFFEELDEDGDGELVLDELPDELAPWVGPADADGDGAIALDELLAADLDDMRAMLEAEIAGFFDEADDDGDGSFSLADLPRRDRADFEQDFLRLDANSDGVLSLEELLALVEDELAGARFEVQGELALMNGVIGASTPGRVLELLLEHPRVHTLVLEEVPGSMDDEANLRAARYVRAHGLRTLVRADSEVSSGGVDFFLAGAVREVELGALLGVHSWGGPGGEGDQVPEDDPEHQLYLDFYEEMGTPAAFYWYTLRAASAHDIHWMTEEEIELYGVRTGSAAEPGSGGER